jgi:hypothetical protein
MMPGQFFDEQGHAVGAIDDRSTTSSGNTLSRRSSSTKTVRSRRSGD